MKTIRSAYLAFIAVLLVPMAASADLIRLEATTTDPSIVTSFEIDFWDTGDGLLQWDEIVAFSGIRVFERAWMDSIDVVPNIAGISTLSFDPTLYLLGAPGDFWVATNDRGGRLYAGPVLWNYELRAVPEPGILSLLGFGLLAVGLLRRRRQS